VEADKPPTSAPALTGYLAAPGLRAELADELAAAGGRGEAPAAVSPGRDSPVDVEVSWHGDLALRPGAPLDVAWAAEVFDGAEVVPIASIGDAARQLRATQRNWVHLSLEHHRRGELIVEKLPRFRPKLLRFGEPVPDAPLGHFGLLAPDRMLVLPRGRTGMARGEFPFEQDHDGPPSRAYLKLWEAFTRLGVRPGPGDACLDLGASPGGWSWVLLQCGADVVAVDKAPLDAALASHPRLTTLEQSAFAPLPAEHDAPDWVFSDVICYPERLLRLVESWLARSEPPKIVATIKFQGEVDVGVVDAFRALPGGRVLHLSANKHELTFVRVGGR